MVPGQRVARIENDDDPPGLQHGEKRNEYPSIMRQQQRHPVAGIADSDQPVGKLVGGAVKVGIGHPVGAASDGDPVRMLANGSSERCRQGLAAAFETRCRHDASLFLIA